MKKLLVILALWWAGQAAAISADAYIVTDLDGAVLLEKNADEIRSIASLTKLVVSKYAQDQDQEELLEVTKEDVRGGHMRGSPLKIGQRYSRKQLMELALVSSDNVAALTVGRHLPEGTDIPFSEWSGLNPANQLSPRQLGELARSLYKTEAAELSIKPSVTIGSSLRRSTNPLINRKGWSFYLSKTGYIRASGGCITVIAEIGGRPLVVVILGSRDTHERWRDLVELRRELGDTDFSEPVFHIPRAKKRRKK